MSSAQSDCVGPHFAVNENLRTLARIVFSKQEFTLDQIAREYLEAVQDKEDKSLGLYGIGAYLKMLTEYNTLHEIAPGRYRMGGYIENRL